MAKRPYKILYTIPNFVTAGSGQAMLNVIKELDRSAFSPAVCVLQTGGRLEKEIKALNIPYLNLPFTTSAKPYLTLPLRFWNLAQPFRPFDFDLWHSFHYLDDYTEPLIAYLSGAKKWVYTKKNMSWRGRAWKIRSKLASAIAIQNTSMREIFFGGQNKRIHYIPPGLDASTFYTKRQGYDLRGKLKLHADTILVGHVAHFFPVKNHGFLLRAFSLCKRPMHLILAGQIKDKVYFDEIQKTVQTLNLSDRVHYLGEMNEIEKVLPELDLFSFCSKEEACPVAVLEAMASALPCVVTDIAGIRDMHTHNETGLIVSPGNVQAFAEALDQLSADPAKRKALGETARKRIQQQFSLKQEAANYQKMYLSCLES